MKIKRFEELKEGAKHAQSSVLKITIPFDLDRKDNKYYCAPKDKFYAALFDLVIINPEEMLELNIGERGSLVINGIISAEDEEYEIFMNQMTEYGEITKKRFYQKINER